MEMITTGGETRFVCDMIRESIQIQERCQLVRFCTLLRYHRTLIRNIVSTGGIRPCWESSRPLARLFQSFEKTTCVPMSSGSDSFYKVDQDRSVY